MNIKDSAIFSVKSRSDSTAVYGFLQKDGSVCQVQNTACHAWAMRGHYNGVAIINKRCFASGANEDTELFYNWLINDSPVARAFITKDAKVANESHTIVDLEAPRNMVGNALVASRGPWEKKSRFSLWAALVRMGIEGHTAYAFITTHDREGSGGIYVKSPDSHHWMVCGGKSAISKLIHRKDWPEYDGPSFIERPGWGEASQHFYGPAPNLLEEDKFDHYYSIAEELVEGKSILTKLNIFAKPGDKEYKPNITELACKLFIEEEWL